MGDFSCLYRYKLHGHYQKQIHFSLSLMVQKIHSESKCIIVWGSTVQIKVPVSVDEVSKALNSNFDNCISRVEM